LSGSAIDIDSKANAAFYGNEDDAKTLFSNSDEDTAASVTQMKSELENLYK